MFSKILIANRGEIALRIIRACREMGIQTAVVYSTADRDAAYLKQADQAICIGDPPPAESYLNIPRIISAAEIADVQAIHPGYGFLAENAHFAEVCRSCKIEFIGPPVSAMAAVGDKVACKRLAKKAKVPTVPGSDGAVDDEKIALRVAQQIGYPVIIKAAAGGGGRGMRIAHNDVTLRASAVRLIKAAGYFNAGTVEFLVDKKQHFYLLEVNARIQVEHPVTEQVTGIDLIKEQIRVAQGERLSFKQSEVPQLGHAIEC